MTIFTKDRINFIEKLIEISEENLIKENATADHDTTNLKETFKDGYQLKHSDRYTQIYSYLINLDFEDLKFIQTVMYVGRDNKFSNNQDTSEEIYKSKFNSLSWNTQSIEAGQIAEKVPLANYLKAGLKILKLN